jgi:hypothetical protein
MQDHCLTRCIFLIKRCSCTLSTHARILLTRLALVQVKMASMIMPTPTFALRKFLTSTASMPKASRRPRTTSPLSDASATSRAALSPFEATPRKSVRVRVPTIKSLEALECSGATAALFDVSDPLGARASIAQSERDAAEAMLALQATPVSLQAPPQSLVGAETLLAAAKAAEHDERRLRTVAGARALAATRSSAPTAVKVGASQGAAAAPKVRPLASLICSNLLVMRAGYIAGAHK